MPKIKVKGQTVQTGECRISEIGLPFLRLFIAFLFQNEFENDDTLCERITWQCFVYTSDRNLASFRPVGAYSYDVYVDTVCTAGVDQCYG